MDAKMIRLAKALLALLVVAVTIFMLFKTVFPDANYEISDLSKKTSEKAYMEIADNAATRMRGLMFRDRIIPILFIFGSEGKYAIHSNFVIAEFDAIYLSPNRTVVEMFRKIAPATQRVSPTKEALYLLELPMDVTGRLNISVGDNLSWKKIGEK